MIPSNLIELSYTYVNALNAKDKAQLDRQYYYWSLKVIVLALLLSIWT